MASAAAQLLKRSVLLLLPSQSSATAAADSDTGAPNSHCGERKQLGAGREEPGRARRAC